MAHKLHCPRDFVQRVDRYYVISKPDGTVFVQRQRPELASDPPMSPHEKIVVMMCDHILSNAENEPLRAQNKRFKAQLRMVKRRIDALASALEGLLQ